MSMRRTFFFFDEDSVVCTPENTQGILRALRYELLIKYFSGFRYPRRLLKGFFVLELEVIFSAVVQSLFPLP